MKYLVLLILVAFSIPVFAQTPIRKVRIEELEAYILKADHPLIVNFWATYCSPCVHEIPYFEKNVTTHRDKRVELILVSLDLPSYYPAQIEGFVRRNNYQSPVWWLNESNADYFCPKIDSSWSGGIPSTLFINNKTHYRKFYERQLTELQLIKSLDDLLKQ